MHLLAMAATCIEHIVFYECKITLSGNDNSEIVRMIQKYFFEHKLQGNKQISCHSILAQFKILMLINICIKVTRKKRRKKLDE